MYNLKHLVSRDAGVEDDVLTPSMVKLLIALLVLVLVAFFLGSILFLFRRRNKKRQASLLPIHQEQPKRMSNHRRLTITATPFDLKKESVYVYNEKMNLVANSSSPPSSPVPEIRITFPDEEDHEGQKKSGKVVVVRISECGSVGMEPCPEEKLPPYHAGDSERFQSLDLERMGGLKEKEVESRFG
ncbi:MAG: hypothetical protein Q9160_000387 [Pyrenula sp. 1 TL-2023]